MKFISLALKGAVLSALCIGHSMAAEPSVVSIVISQKVVARRPVGPTLQNSDRFRILDNKVYAWMGINKEIPGGVVHHLWYFQENLMDDIRMQFSKGAARIYSVKTIKRPYVGVWRVEVRQDDKLLLDTRYFQVEVVAGEMVVTVLERALKKAK